jgi:prolyl-tRNA synthetase
MKDAEVNAAAEALYGDLLDTGIEVLIDDRDVRPGVKFADAELIGIPFRVSVGPRDLAEGAVEITKRANGEKERVQVGEAARRLRELVAG